MTIMVRSSLHLTKTRTRTSQTVLRHTLVDGGTEDVTVSIPMVCIYGAAQPMGLGSTGYLGKAMNIR